MLKLSIDLKYLLFLPAVINIMECRKFNCRCSNYGFKFI